MAWLFLLLAGIEEIISVIAMKNIDGFRRKWPIVVMVVGFICSFYFLSTAMQVIPAGVAYAVWAGVGTLGIVLVGMIWFKEKLNVKQLGYLGLILIGVVGLRLTT